MFGGGCSDKRFAAPNEIDDTFRMEIVFAEEENSDDANGETTTLILENKNGNMSADYMWEYSGYHPDEDFNRKVEESFWVQTETVEALLKIVEENNLVKQVVEERDTSLFGQVVDVRFTYKNLGELTESRVVGMSDVWEGDKTEGGNIKNTAFVKAVDDLLYEMISAEDIR